MWSPGPFAKAVFFMNEDEKLARGLVEKAEHDLKLVEIGLEHDAPLDTICFHLQQAAEKLIKAALSSRRVTFPYTHDLDQLIDLGLAEFPGIEAFRPALSGFSTYAVAMRYDSAFYPDRDEVLAALETVKKLRAFILERLPPEIVP